MSIRAAHALSVALAATLVSASVAAPAQAAPAPELTVTVATANGSGCPGTTATASVRPDGASFTIDFNGYFAWSGAGAPVTGFRRNCQFSLQIPRPEGLTYAVEQADYSGYALLGDGVSGVQAARYYFQGESATTAASHEFAGPLADSWQTTDSFDPATLRFAPCGTDRNLNVNTELRVGRVATSTATNLMVLNPTVTLHLTWQECA